MADLLSPEDWAEFDDAIGDVVDTFFNYQCTIHKYDRNYSNFYGDEKDDVTDKQDFVVRGLNVFDKSGKALNDRMAMGDIDLAEGYILMYYHDLVDAGLIDPATKKPTIVSEQDEVTFQGEKYTLLGDAQVGPVEDADNTGRYVLVKLFFKRKLRNG